MLCEMDLYAPVMMLLIGLTIGIVTGAILVRYNDDTEKKLTSIERRLIQLQNAPLEQLVAPSAPDWPTYRTMQSTIR